MTTNTRAIVRCGWYTSTRTPTAVSDAPLHVNMRTSRHDSVPGVVSSVHTSTGDDGTTHGKTSGTVAVV